MQVVPHDTTVGCTWSPLRCSKSMEFSCKQGTITASWKLRYFPCAS